MNAQPGTPRPLEPPAQVWLAISSLRTTAVLVILLAGFAGLAVFIPQGSTALELARVSESTLIRELAAYGLTDVLTSAWLRALGVLLAVNVVAVLIRIRGKGPGGEFELSPPTHAPLSATLSAKFPERAAGVLRETFRSVLGVAPISERVNGAKVSFVFDSNPRASAAPLLAHLGLVLLVLGAGLASTPPPTRRSLVRAELEVTDSRSGTMGRFDLAQGESMRFFQWRYEYTIRDYLPSKNGLGPAIRIERVMPDERRFTDFWVYLEAPPGFDAAHRRDAVSIVAKRMGLAPMPGEGMASKPASVLLVAGLGLLLAGLFATSRPEGRLWVEAEGDRVELLARPRYAADGAFARGFERWRKLAEGALDT